MTCIMVDEEQILFVQSQSAFVRGFIDDRRTLVVAFDGFESQSAFVRGFIDDRRTLVVAFDGFESQSAFVRGFIDDKNDDGPEATTN